jgi:hypothetical protein
MSFVSNKGRHETKAVPRGVANDALAEIDGGAPIGTVEAQRRVSVALSAAQRTRALPLHTTRHLQYTALIDYLTKH